jgi:hypothetical protein
MHVVVKYEGFLENPNNHPLLELLYEDSNKNYL